MCKKRVKKYVKENPPAEKKGNYDTFRTEVDKATKFMCLTYQELVTRKANWQGIDTEVKKELMTYVISTPFKILMKSKGHRKRVDKMTYMTTSDFVCYWCLSEECLHIRRFHTSPGNTNLERGELDKQTMDKCSVYNRKKVETQKRT